MRVLGVDPGALDTGVAVIDTATLEAVEGGPRLPVLLESLTMRRPDLSARGVLLGYDRRAHVSPAYLADVLDQIESLVARHGVQRVAVEGLRGPTGFAGGRRSPINPADVMAAAAVYGAVASAQIGPPVIVVPPGGNGRRREPWRYPAPIAAKPGGKGHDKRRHERSAYDVACSAALATMTTPPTPDQETR